LSEAGEFHTRPDVAIVVFGENPYAEGAGDVPTLEYSPGDKRDLALLRRLRAAQVPVVAVLLSGRPLWVNAELNAADSFVAAWLPGPEGEGVADVLFRAPDGSVRYDFRGKLPFSWPRACRPWIPASRRCFLTATDSPTRTRASFSRCPDPPRPRPPLPRRDRSSIPSRG